MQSEDTVNLAAKQREEKLRQDLASLQGAQSAALESLQQQLDDMTDRSNMLEDQLSASNQALQTLQFEKEQSETELESQLADLQQTNAALQVRVAELERKHQALLALPDHANDSVLDRSSGRLCGSATCTCSIVL
eukprot:m.203875 g.203875  ORF g.203875 m.203875 type:complete len:135 (-) comp17077_c0_seq13:604-1008(-)